jgi:7-cyano-7-deazaguanine reductase
VSLNYKDLDPSVLRSLPEPTLSKRIQGKKYHGQGYEQRIDIPEFTFLGAHGQPDFGHITIWFYSDQKIIELKSLKEYIFDWRDVHISYERAINVMFDHLTEVYEPARLRLEIAFRTRGGISSNLVIDSDWACRGGSDQVWRDHK